MFNGLDMGLGNLSRISDAKTRSISAENFTGEKGKAAMATEGMGAGCARDLGQGWKISPSIVVAKHSTFTLADIEGPGAIQSIWLTGNVVNPDNIIRFYWDGQEFPSVEAPVSAFFAYGFANNIDGTTGKFPTLSSLPVLVAPNRGCNCFWEMPFRGHCKITLENLSDDDRVCYFQINYTLTEIPEDMAYFHAQYRQAKPVDFKAEYTILDGVKGRGQYVGTALFVNLNAAGGWWGEGEIKFYMDGDTKFPTICGTGTEDYFGGAYDWDINGKYNTYSGPFMGMYSVIQSDALYGSQQRFSMYRWHIMDPIRFENDLRVTIQDLGWHRGGRYLSRRDDFMSVAYWYQTIPAEKFPPLPTIDELEIV
jgi:Protein of unknown function (DUF2961).